MFKRIMNRIKKELRCFRQYLQIRKQKVNVDQLLKDADLQRVYADPHGFIRATGLEARRTYTAFSGADVCLFITDEPWDRKQYSTCKSLVACQGLSWAIQKDNETAGTLILLNMDGSRAPELAGKYITYFAANEYGHSAVVSSFKIEEVVSEECGLSIDDIVCERVLTWVGKYMPEVVGPVEQGDLA